MERSCSQFGIGSSGLKVYHGSVSMDDQALYFLVGINIGLAALGGLGGAIGGAIVGGVAHAIGYRADLPYETTFSALDERVRLDLAWGRVSPDARVLVVLKRAVKPVSLSVWMGCTVKTADITISPGVSF